MNPGSEPVPLTRTLFQSIGGATATQQGPGVPSPPSWSPPLTPCSWRPRGHPRSQQPGRFMSLCQCQGVCRLLCYSMTCLLSVCVLCVPVRLGVSVFSLGFCRCCSAVSLGIHVCHCSIIVFSVSVTVSSVLVFCCRVSKPNTMFAHHCVLVSVTVSITVCLCHWLLCVCLCLRHSGSAYICPCVSPCLSPYVSPSTQVSPCVLLTTQATGGRVGPTGAQSWGPAHPTLTLPWARLGACLQ